MNKILWALPLFLAASIRAQDYAAGPIPIGRLGTVADGIYRGEQLDSPENYRFLGEELRVDTVVSLRYFHENDRDLCSRYGLRCVRFPLNPVFTTEAFIGTLKDAFRFTLQERAAGRRVFIHCWRGSDRTGALSAAIMIRERTCGTSYEADRVWSEVERSLDENGFFSGFAKLRRTIRGWVYEREQNAWLCD